MKHVKNKKGLTLIELMISISLLLVLVTLLPWSLQAAEPQALLDAVNLQRLQSYQLQLQFHLLSLEEADPQVATQMQATAKQFALQVERLNELSVGLALDAEVLALQAQARDFQQWVLANEVLTQGWVSINTLNAMSSSGVALNQAYSHVLDSLRAQGSHGDPLLEQAILLQQITAAYVRESSSLDGGGAIYDNARDVELPVDQLAVQFRQQLTLLQQQPHVHPKWVVVSRVTPQLLEAVADLAPGAQLVHALPDDAHPALLVECAGHSAIASG